MIANNNSGNKPQYRGKEERFRKWKREQRMQRMQGMQVMQGMQGIQGMQGQQYLTSNALSDDKMIAGPNAEVDCHYSVFMNEGSTEFIFSGNMRDSINILKLYLSYIVVKSSLFQFVVDIENSKVILFGVEPKEIVSHIEKLMDKPFCFSEKFCGKMEKITQFEYEKLYVMTLIIRQK